MYIVRSLLSDFNPVARWPMGDEASKVLSGGGVGSAVSRPSSTFLVLVEAGRILISACAEIAVLHLALSFATARCDEPQG
jgi:hypothetical protein